MHRISDERLNEIVRRLRTPVVGYDGKPCGEEFTINISEIRWMANEISEKRKKDAS